MKMLLPYGFRIVGATTKARRLVDAAAAFVGYCSCDAKADVEKEAYLSAFTYGDDFKALLDTTGSARGFNGACWSPYLWLDVDNEGDPEKALLDARRLASSIFDRYRELDDEALLIFFSGSKGYHLGLPTSWGPTPSAHFHRVARRFAERLALNAGAAIDASIYDRVRCFRAPNSRHPKTGLHKRRLNLDELLQLTPKGIRNLAEHPLPFDVPTQTTDLRKLGTIGTSVAVKSKKRPKRKPNAVQASPVARHA